LYLLPLLLALFVSSAAAQGSRQLPVNISADKSDPADDQHTPSSMEEEMRAKRAIKYAEVEHKETLDRARELCELGTKLRDSFQHKNSLDREDSKRLERLTKLAKQLRSKAGGSDAEVTLDKPPADLDGAVKQVAEVSESLSSLVQKTPRQVVSACVIDEANVLLQLIDLVRQFSSLR
jgi:hypothetical protein